MPLMFHSLRSAELFDGHSPLEEMQEKFAKAAFTVRLNLLNRQLGMAENPDPELADFMRTVFNAALLGWVASLRQGDLATTMQLQDVLKVPGEWETEYGLDISEPPDDDSLYLAWQLIGSTFRTLAQKHSTRFDNLAILDRVSLPPELSSIPVNWDRSTSHLDLHSQMKTYHHKLPGILEAPNRYHRSTQLAVGHFCNVAACMRLEN
jgi:hypothetical protein